jgi:chloride channel 3/4/5
MNGYPFLDNKGEYPFSTTASQVMRPGLDMPGLKVIYNGHNTIGELETLLRSCPFSGFPVVAGLDSMLLIVGFCARRDLDLALRGARKAHSYVTTDSKVYFTTNIPDADQTGAAPLRLRKVMDLAPITVIFIRKISF